MIAALIIAADSWMNLEITLFIVKTDHGMKGGRHDRLRDLIFKQAQRASLSPTMEMPGLVPGSQSRPADVYLPSWVDGRKTAFDIIVLTVGSEHRLDLDLCLVR